MGYQLTSSRLHYDIYLNTFNFDIIRQALIGAGVDFDTPITRYRLNVETDLGQMVYVTLNDVFKGVLSGWMITAKECREFAEKIRNSKQKLRAIIPVSDNWAVVEKFLNYCDATSECNGFYIAEKFNPQTARLKG